MSASFDDRILVNVVADAALDGPTVFNRFVVLSPDSVFAERVRWYSTLVDAAEDSELSANALADLTVAFGQSQVARPIGVARVAAEVAQVERLSVDTPHAGDWTLTVNETEMVFAAATESAIQIAQALRVLLAAQIALGLPVTYASDDGATEITAAVPGVAFTASLTPPSGGAVTETHVVANLSIGDELSEVLAEDSSWYGLVAPRHAVQTTRLHLAAWTEANAKLALQPVNSVANGAAITALGYKRTAVCYHSSTPGNFALAWMALKLAANPDERATTWSWAALVGVLADDISPTDANTARAADVNLYLPTDFAPATGLGVAADGTPIANVVAKDWAAARVREGVAELIINASSRNEKIPYDNGGILTLAGAVNEVLKRGERIGHFRRDSTIVTAPDIVDVPAADISDEILRLSAEATLAGAINAVSFTIVARTA